jgi:RHS repeat-associated protein
LPTCCTNPLLSTAPDSLFNLLAQRRQTASKGKREAQFARTVTSSLITLICFTLGPAPKCPPPRASGQTTRVTQFHSDFEVSVTGTPPQLSGTPIEKTARTPGLAQTASSDGSTQYLHGNQIGTMERMTDSDGEMANRTVMTAFGEPVFSSHTSQASSRFGFAGAHGYEGSSYESGDPIADLGWLHVGARYYDPGSGRFDQRDPVGVAGGVNTYAYCNSNPVNSSDPTGLLPLTPQQITQVALYGTGFIALVSGYPLTSYTLAALGSLDFVVNAIAAAAVGIMPALATIGIGLLYALAALFIILILAELVIDAFGGTGPLSCLAYAILRRH